VEAIEFALRFVDRGLRLLEFLLRLRPAPSSLPLFRGCGGEHPLCLVQPCAGGAVIRPAWLGCASFHWRRSRSWGFGDGRFPDGSLTRAGLGCGGFGGCGFGVGEQGAEPARLGLALKPGCEQVACGVVVDGGGLEGCADCIAAAGD